MSARENMQGKTEGKVVGKLAHRHGKGEGQCGHFATHQHLCLPLPRVTHLTWAWPAGSSGGWTGRDDGEGEGVLVMVEGAWW